MGRNLAENNYNFITMKQNLIVSRLDYQFFFNNVTTAYKHGSIKIFYVLKNQLKLIL